MQTQRQFLAPFPTISRSSVRRHSPDSTFVIHAFVSFLLFVSFGNLMASLTSRSRGPFDHHCHPCTAAQQDSHSHSAVFAANTYFLLQCAHVWRKEWKNKAVPSALKTSRSPREAIFAPCKSIHLSTFKVSVEAVELMIFLNCMLSCSLRQCIQPSPGLNFLR